MQFYGVFDQTFFHCLKKGSSCEIESFENNCSPSIMARKFKMPRHVEEQNFLMGPKTAQFQKNSALLRKMHEPK